MVDLRDAHVVADSLVGTREIRDAGGGSSRAAYAVALTDIKEIDGRRFDSRGTLLFLGVIAVGSFVFLVSQVGS
jgi:hypothetical protein